MVEYICFRCGYNGKQKICLIRHLNRKNVCKPTDDDVEIEAIKDYYGFENNDRITPNHSKITPKHTEITPNHSISPPTVSLQKTPNNSIFDPKSLQNNSKTLHFENNKPTCEYCLRTYTRKDNLTKHLKTCKKKKEAELLIISKDNKIIKMEKQIEQLLLEKKQTNITNNNTIHNTTNNTININNYGDENLKHLRSKDFADLLNGIYGAVPKLIKQIHFDPEHPENQNIKLPNKKYPYLKILKNSKWELVDKKPELLDLIDSKYFILKERYYKILEKNKYNLSNLQKKTIDNFIDKYQEEDKAMLLDLLNRTELVLLNNS